MKALFRPTITLIAVSLVLLGCATSSGTSIKRVAEKDRKESSSERRATPPAATPIVTPTPTPFTTPSPFTPLPKREAALPEGTALEPVQKRTGPGFTIQSFPLGAELFLDGVDVGKTPYEETRDRPKTISVRLVYAGYQPLETFVNFSAQDWQYFDFSLRQAFGRLDIGEGFDKALLSTSGRQLHLGLNRLGVGSFVLSAARFGFVTQTIPVEIMEDATTKCAAEPWQPAPLKVSRFRLMPPWLSGEGVVTFEFDVSGPGAGLLKIADAQGRIVHQQELGPFTMSAQSADWVPRKEVAGLPEGSYSASLIIGDEPPVQQNFQLTKQPKKESAQEFWSSSTGLLFSPVADVLAVGTRQWNSSLLGVSGNGYTQFLENASFAAGAAPHLEGALSASGRFWNDSNLNSWYATGALKSLFVDQNDWKVAGYASAAISSFWGELFVPPTTDPFTNPTGFKGGLVLSLKGGPWEWSFAPELAWAWYGVSYDLGQEPESQTLGYLRTGVRFSTSLADVALSTALRTPAFGSPWNGVSLPWQSGAEIRFHAFEDCDLNFLGSLEWWDSKDWALSLGVGVTLKSSIPSYGPPNTFAVLPLSRD